MPPAASRTRPVSSRPPAARRPACGRRASHRRRLAAGRALHVDAAAEVRAVGNRDPGRRQIAVDRSVVANVRALTRRDVAVHFTLHDDRLGEDLGLDAAVGADRQHVLFELDPALHLTLDRQILAAAELALDDDALADVHHIPLLQPIRGRPRYGRFRGAAGRISTRRLRWPYGLITLPHSSDLQGTTRLDAGRHQTVGPAARHGNRQYTGRKKTLSSAFLFYDLGRLGSRGGADERGGEHSCE